MTQVKVQDSNIGAIVKGDATFYGDMYFNTTPTGRPLQRPPQVEHFIGREAELAQLLNDLQPGRVATLCGPGGIGKTALSSEVLWRLAPGNEAPKLFPDGIVFYSFYGQPNMDLAFEHIVRSFDREAKDISYNAARRSLAGKQALLVLDGTEEAEDLRKVLAIMNLCGVLITSRKADDAPGDWQDIPLLPMPEAVKLLRALAKEQTEEADVAREICELTGGLPLAVRLVGHYLSRRRQRAESYLEWLRASPLAALNQGDRQSQSVPILLERNIAQVPEEARQALALTGLLALVPFGEEAVASAFGIKSFEATHLMGHLVNYGLLIRPGIRFEISHPLIHTYVRKNLRPSTEAIKRLTGFFIALLRDHGNEGPEGYARLDADRIHLMRILTACMEREDWKSVVELVFRAREYIVARGHCSTRLTLFESGLKAMKEFKCNNFRAYEGLLYEYLGSTYVDLCQLEKAVENYEQALNISREVGNYEMEAKYLGFLGSSYRDLQQIKKAIGFHEQALAMSRELGLRKVEGEGLWNLGVDYNTLGEPKKAIEYYKQALDVSRELGERDDEMRFLGSLGVAYNDLGKFNKAIYLNEQVLKYRQETGERQSIGVCLGNLGLAYRGLGQMERAIDYLLQELAISREVGDRRGERRVIANLMSTYHDLGDIEKQVEYFEQALPITREVGDRQEELDHLDALAGTYYGIGHLEKAVEYYEQAIPICRELGDRQGEGYYLANLGYAYSSLGNVVDALDYLKQSLAVFEAISSQGAEKIRADLNFLSQRII